VNCIIWGNQPEQIDVLSGDDPLILFSDVEDDVWTGEGNISIDPYFVAPGYWADAMDMDTPVDASVMEAVWIQGDYHLQSENGRYDLELEVWVDDSLTSPGIDMGDPNAVYGNESNPNGDRINVGAYGGTIEASRSVIGMVFVNIPGGTFEMGDHYGVGGSDEKPMHTVTLDGFKMSKYETTHAQYAEYLNAALADGLIQVVNGVVYAASDTSKTKPFSDTHSSSSYSQINYSQGQFSIRSRDGQNMGNHPVARVSWYGVQAFCDYYGYRLPTDAEWEYAARGGYHDPYFQYPWGNNEIEDSKLNYNKSNPLNLTDYPYTCPVGYYGQQGAYGLCDMSGNVREWCQDRYDRGYYRSSPASNPTGPAYGTLRVLRGGSWDSRYDSTCRAAGRTGYDPNDPHRSLGFRVCVSVSSLD